MTTLAANAPRDYELLEQGLNDLPVIASDIIYEGAAVGDDSNGNARPLEAGDPFWGFAQRKADNSGGAAGAAEVTVAGKGAIELTVTGASTIAANGELVYAADDNDFTLTASTNTLIGRVKRWISGTKCIVEFRALWHRDADIT